MKGKILIPVLLLCFALRPAAQTADESDALYREFVSLINGSTDKDKIYDALYRCYTATAAVLESSQPTSSAYSRALGNMKDIVRYLPNGAAYSSSVRRNANALIFAKAYVDMAVRPDMSGEGLIESQSFAQLSYYAASNLINSRQTREAIPYLQAYIRSGEEKFRKTVFINLCKACGMAGDYSTAVSTFDEAIRNYPSDYDILSAAVNLCIDSGDNVNLQRYVSLALAKRPNDQTLLNIQGKLYEENREYEKALQVYKTLQKSNPRAIDVVKHLAVDNYNIAVLNYNSFLSESDTGEQKRLKKNYITYFTEAIDYLKAVTQSDPSSLKYTQALAVAYKCTEEDKELEAVNNKLASMGGGRIPSDYIPSLISYGQESGQTALAQNTGGSKSSGSKTSGYSTGGSNTGGSHSSAQTASAASQSPSSPAEIPSYSSFAKRYIEEAIEEWQRKDDYETVSEYRDRVTEKTRSEKIREMQREAEEEYIEHYRGLVDFRSLELKPYDAENGVFLITSEALGDMVVPVPRANNEARLFQSSWNGMEFRDPKYFIADDRLALAGLTFVTPTGKQYRYDNEAALNYTETSVEVNFSPIDNSLLAASGQGGKGGKQTVSRQSLSVGSSDVDVNIPESKVVNSRTFAVIIANEEYINVAGVPMALNDGRTFAKYCEGALGLPHENVRFYANASFGTMLRAMRDIKNIASAYGGDISIVFYYAGHGIPNEATKDAYLLPVDADGTQTEGCYSLNKLYAELGSTGARSIVVFLDACFSGSKREEGMLASARGVALKAKREDPRGNMVVFSAASGDETAYPYTAQGHGLFTYFLLKKLQETKGDVSLGELSEYITENVRQQSVVINHKAQTPSAIPSESMQSGWRDMKLK